jgi:hypothetical protein
MYAQESVDGLWEAFMSAGTPSTSTFGVNYIEILLRLIMGIAGSAAGILMLPLWPRSFGFDLETFIRAVVPLLGLGGGAYFLLTTLFTLINAPRITLSRDGLRYQSRTRSQEWHWHELTAVDGGLTTYVSHSYPFPFYTGGRYRFFSGDKVALKVENTTAKVQEFYEAAAQYITESHLDAFYRRLKAGETLMFGQVKLSYAQIEVGRDTLPIQQVATIQTDVQMEQQYLAIHSTTGKGAWKSFSLKEFYNPWLFQALVKRLVDERGGRI